MTEESLHRILVADPICEEGIDRLRKAAAVDVLADITAHELRSRIGVYDALIVRGRTKVTSALVECGNRLRVVGRAGVGLDNVDIDACRRNGVTVVNAPVAAGVAVAELTLLLLLCLARRVPYADSEMKKGNWAKKELMGVELHGKVLGLIAIGKIGSEVACRASAIGMHVIGYDPYLSREQIRSRGVEAATLQEVLRQSDFISIHTPLTGETQHMIGVQSIDSMKDGVGIVCAARGGVIDEQALLRALKSGKVLGAALDVFETEPPGASELLQHPNVIATPHIGASTREAHLRVGLDIAEEVMAALADGELRWRVV